MKPKSPAEPAENSGEKSVTRGRPFQKGESGNPGGRPRSAATRAATGETIEALLEELRERRSKLKFEELMIGLKYCAEALGLLTPGERVTLEGRLLESLGHILSGAQLSDAQRSKIIDDFQARQLKQAHADEP